MLLLRGKQIRLTDLLVEGEVDDISGVVENLGAGDSQSGESVEWQDWVVCGARLDEATETVRQSGSTSDSQKSVRCSQREDLVEVERGGECSWESIAHVDGAGRPCLVLSLDAERKDIDD